MVRVGSCATVRADEIEAWLIDQLAERLGVSRESIDPREPFAAPPTPPALPEREAEALLVNEPQSLEQEMRV